MKIREKAECDFDVVSLGEVMLRLDPAGNIKIDKAKSTEKVDGAVAMVMAYAQIMQGNKPTIYEGKEREGGLLML